MRRSGAEGLGQLLGMALVGCVLYLLAKAALQAIVAAASVLLWTVLVVLAIGVLGATGFGVHLFVRRYGGWEILWFNLWRGVRRVFVMDAESADRGTRGTPRAGAQLADLENAALLAGIREDTLAQWVRGGQLTARRFPDGRILVDIREVKHVMESIPRPS